MIYAILGAILMTSPLAATSQLAAIEAKQEHQTITAEELKSWYDQKKQMVVVDARSKKYFDGRLLPNAKWLSAESSEEEILAAIPNKNSVVVVYCWSVDCPAGGWLYDKLHKMGYPNVYEYHEGLSDWMEKGYPTTKQK